MQYCIFSFNRGQFLTHCVDSIQACDAEARICIIDDDSTDPDTCTTLEQLRSSCTIVQPGTRSTGKHGGLYHNMQVALERFPDEPLLCFLQDDMQLTRELSAEDKARLFQYCQDEQISPFIHPCFLKAGMDREAKAFHFEVTTGAYYRHSLQHSAGTCYSDVMICSPARLLAAGWYFQHSEKENEQQARRLFPGRMHHLFSPFMMWLPSVPAWRGKKKTWALRLAESRDHCGFHPLAQMSDEDCMALNTRSPAQLPVADDFLRLQHPAPLPVPWRYYPLQGRRWLKILNSIELRLRRLFGQ